MANLACYIDGFNLYHAIKDLGDSRLKWLNLQALAASYLQKHDVLISVTYFTAVKSHPPQKYWRHMAYLDALRATGVEVVTSKFLKNKWYCEGFQRYCKFDEEKQTDVALAVRVFRDAHAGIVDRIILVTADSDQIPVVQHVLDAFPLVSVEIAAPPRRMRQARELCGEATKYHEITEGRLKTCLLARNVPDETGRIVARCPSSYL